ncbi:MAG TPA: GNAT family protein [Tepidisphaeraceae bacterium]|jgi:RimJ/RimL family protein N-acetyltransferase|nr:GNAT family protein [Tepidisphaeraceae bacterium]
MANVSFELPETIETERLIIRPPRPGDGAAVNEAVRESFAELHRWMIWAKEVPTPEASEENVMAAVAKFAAREDLRLHLYDKASGALVGSSGLHAIDWAVPKCEIGYWMRTSRAGQGYATESAAAIAELALATLGARRVEIRVDPLNERSWRVAERLGFTLEGTLRNDDRGPDGRLRDVRIYAKVTADR